MNNFCIFAASNGHVAERSGAGLQNQLQQFDSARDLQEPIAR